MEQVAVIHSAFGDTPHVVAFVDVDPSLSLNKKLEYAYRWTNNVMGSWSRDEEVFEDGNQMEISTLLQGLHHYMKMEWV